jgi:hypothetical protein
MLLIIVQNIFFVLCKKGLYHYELKYFLPGTKNIEWNDRKISE